MVVATHDEFQLIYGNIDSLEEGGDHESVVLCPFLDQFNWSFEGVKEGMNVSEKYLDVTAGAEEMGDIDLPSIVNMRLVDSLVSRLPWAQNKHNEVCHVRYRSLGGDSGVPTDQ